MILKKAVNEHMSNSGQQSKQFQTILSVLFVFTCSLNPSCIYLVMSQIHHLLQVNICAMFACLPF